MTELFRNTFGTRTVPTRSMSGTRMEHEGVATSAGPSQGLGPECDGPAVCSDVHASILAQVYGWRNGRSKTPAFCNDSGQVLSAALRMAASLVSSLQSFAQPLCGGENPHPSPSRDSGQALPQQTGEGAVEPLSLPKAVIILCNRAHGLHLNRAHG